MVSSLLAFEIVRMIEPYEHLVVQDLISYPLIIIKSRIKYKYDRQTLKVGKAETEE